MIELPEASVLAKQINNTILRNKITNVIASHWPHKFAWFHGDPQNYHNLLYGQTIVKTSPWGGMVEIKTENTTLLFNDGVAIRYHRPGEKRPEKHQLLVEFQDNSALSAGVQMYGGLYCFKDNEFDNFYYRTAKEKPSPLTPLFDENYFERLLSASDCLKLSAKAFLATEQRIPGLGNGVLQDILWNAKIHPRKKIGVLTDPEKETLFNSIKTILFDMTELGGRDTEKDLFGQNGGYQTVMSKNNAGLPCPICGDLIKKESYLGGSIYYCSGCQKIS
jgi:formamidopyrimidine-DNA glycosylase